MITVGSPVRGHRKTSAIMKAWDKAGQMVGLMGEV